MLGSNVTSQNTPSTRRSRRVSPTEIGSIEVGKLADLVLWSPAFFGVKPDLVIKGGTIACAPMGDPNASIPTPQPVHYRPMFGAIGRAMAASCITFVSGAALEAGIGKALGLERRPGRGVEHPRRHRQEGDDPQRRHAGDRGRRRNLRGPRRRRAADLRARDDPADGAAVFSVLMRAVGRRSCRRDTWDTEARDRSGADRLRPPLPPPHRSDNGVGRRGADRSAAGGAAAGWRRRCCSTTGDRPRSRASPNRCWKSTRTTTANSSASPGTSATAICRCSCWATASASAPITSSGRWSRGSAATSSDRGAVRSGGRRLCRRRPSSPSRR